MLLEDHLAEPESAPAQPVLPDWTTLGQVRLGWALLQHIPTAPCALPFTHLLLFFRCRMSRAMQCQSCLPGGSWAQLARSLAGSRGTRSVSMCAAAMPGELGSVPLALSPVPRDIRPQLGRDVGHPRRCEASGVGGGEAHP